jgi:hypothetical protein
LPKDQFYGLQYIPQVSNETNDEVYYELGRFVELLIKIITLGQGHRIALFIAKKMGYDDCGCKARKNKLDLFWDKILNKLK